MASRSCKAQIVIGAKRRDPGSIRGGRPAKQVAGGELRKVSFEMPEPPGGLSFHVKLPCAGSPVVDIQDAVEPHQDAPQHVAAPSLDAATPGLLLLQIVRQGQRGQD